MPPKKQPSRAAGKRKRQQDSPEAEDQSRLQDVGNVRKTRRPAPGEPPSVDEATTQRLRQAYPFLTHTRRAFVNGTSAHQAATMQSSFPTRDELAKWKSDGGDPATYPARLGNLAEWMEEIAAAGPPPKPNTQRARAIARARAEEAEAQEADADTETTDSTDQAISQSNPGALQARAMRSRRETSSKSDAEEEEFELAPKMGKEARLIWPRGSTYDARKNEKGKSPSPFAEMKGTKSKNTPTKWVTLKLPPSKPPIPKIPGLNFEVKNEIASELIENVAGDPAYDSEETINDPDLIEMKDAASILMSMAADEEADRQFSATRKHEAAEPLLMLSNSSGTSHDTREGVGHSDGKTDEQQDPGDRFAPAPVRVTYKLAHAPSRITNRPPKHQKESLLCPPAVNERGRATKPKKRKREEIEET